jgi:hypothetical protein
MARMVAEGRGAGVTFDRLDVDSVATAVRTALSGLAELRTRAEAAVGPWRATQNIGLYFDRLADDLGPAGLPLRGRALS